MYGFRTNDSLSALTDIPPEDYIRTRQMYHEEAEQAMAFANATAKSYYDAHHKPIDLGFMAYLRLHHDYIIPDLTN